jgi:hypothetical protein
MIATRTVRLIRRGLERFELKCLTVLLDLGCCDGGRDVFSLDLAVPHVNDPVSLLSNLRIVANQD